MIRHSRASRGDRAVADATRPQGPADPYQPGSATATPSSPAGTAPPDLGATKHPDQPGGLAAETSDTLRLRAVEGGLGSAWPRAPVHRGDRIFAVSAGLPSDRVWRLRPLRCPPCAEKTSILSAVSRCDREHCRPVRPMRTARHQHEQPRSAIVRRHASRVVVTVLLGLGFLAGPFAAPSVAAPCPPGTEWDPIQAKCIPIGPLR